MERDAAEAAPLTPPLPVDIDTVPVENLCGLAGAEINQVRPAVRVALVRRADDLGDEDRGQRGPGLGIGGWVLRARDRGTPDRVRRGRRAGPAYSAAAFALGLSGALADAVSALAGFDSEAELVLGLAVSESFLAASLYDFER